MIIPRPRAVFDCNVLFQALARPDGPAGSALRLVEQNRVTLHLSRWILREFRLTLGYPRIRKTFPLLTDEVVSEFCAHLLFRGILVRNIPNAFSLARDPDDEPYINLAVKVGADFLVTRDQDLLTLMTDHTLVAKRFRRSWPTLQIVEPSIFVADIATDE